MRASLCVASIVFGLSFATLPVMAQHGGHGGGHVGGASHVAPPAHFYGGSGGIHAPVAPMHIPAPVAMPGPIHMQTAPIHSPAAMIPHPVPGIAPQPHPHQVPIPSATGHTPSPVATPTNSAQQFEAARLAAIESGRWGGLGYGYPGYQGYYGWGGVPYYGAYPYSLYGHYGFNSIHNARPYYYGYLVGVPYINYNNYSPVYYSDYSSLPSTTGTVTTQNLLPGDSAPSDNDGSSPDMVPAVNPYPSISLREAREAIVKAEKELATGQYQLAVQNAGKAAFQLHEEARVHEVLWLALMGLGDYRGAAIEAHAVDHFGVTPRWNDIAMKHEDQTRFAEQMKKLEQFVDRNQDSDFAAFLLGYNYMVMGRKAEARQWLEKAQAMDPQDVLCAGLVASLKADTVQPDQPQAKSSADNS